VINPADEEAENLLAWYFEEHLRYPFLDKDKEAQAVQKIAEYGKSLFAQVLGGDSSFKYRNLKARSFDQCRIEIRGSAALHGLHWESMREAADMYLELGRIAQRRGQLDRAEATYRQALAIYVDRNERHRSALVSHLLGTVAHEQYRYAEAEEACRNALDFWGKTDPLSASGTATLLGQVLTDRGEHCDATAVLLNAATTWRLETGEWDPECLQLLKQERAFIEPGKFRQLIEVNVSTNLVGELKCCTHWSIPGCNGQAHRRGCTIVWYWIAYIGTSEIRERNRSSVAQKIQTLFIDDLDGSTAEGTVRFGLDGTEYEIDLNAEHARALRDALARYVGAARRANGAARGPARTGRRARANGLNTTEVREWAKAQGIEVKDRGRVPAELIVKFKAAAGQ
jgi:tetratricopeptide (TPR) repeat protein